MSLSGFLRPIPTRMWCRQTRCTGVAGLGDFSANVYGQLVEQLIVRAVERARDGRPIDRPTYFIRNTAVAAPNCARPAAFRPFLVETALINEDSGFRSPGKRRSL